MPHVGILAMNAPAGCQWTFASDQASPLESFMIFHASMRDCTGVEDAEPRSYATQRFQVGDSWTKTCEFSRRV